MLEQEPMMYFPYHHDGNYKELSQGGLHGHNSMSNRGNADLLGSHSLNGSANGPIASASGGSINSLGMNMNTRASISGLGAVLSQLSNGGTSNNVSAGASATGGLRGAAGSMNIPNGSRLSTGGLALPGRSVSQILQQGANMSSTQYNPSGDLLAMIARVPPQVASLLGNNFSTSTGAGMQGNHLSTNGQLGGMGLASDGNGSEGAAFDLNEFPLLGARQSSTGGPQEMFRKQGVSVNTIGHQNQEFSIQNEDFPALPGFKGRNANLTTEFHQDRQHDGSLSVLQPQLYTMGRSAGFPLGVPFGNHRQQQQGTLAASNSLSSSINSSDSGDMLHMHSSSGENFSLSRGPANNYHSQVHLPPVVGSAQVSLPSLRSGSRVMPSNLSTYNQLLHQYEQYQPHLRIGTPQQQLTAIGKPNRELGLRPMPELQVAADRFGLLGLLSVIKMTDPELTTLALGTDLTTLGLNLNSRENLYKTFASPWADGPIKGEPDFTLPQCYVQLAPKLQPGYFPKFRPDTLFYIFYSMPNDEAQLYAAIELCNRGWFYHKTLETWLTHIPNVEPLVKTSTYERGSYLFFDHNTWETGRKDNFVLHYESLERPQLPTQQQQQQS